MRKLLVFRHVPNAHLGTMQSVLLRGGVSYEYVDPAESLSRPVNLGLASGLIFLGGPMSANDPLPCIGRELRLIQEAIQRALPMLGICLGAQLIAKAAGGRVHAMASREIGWFPVYPTEAAASDSVFRFLPAAETVFHWHAEAVELPTCARRLAWSDACAVQGFRLGDSVYGIQFHPEVTPAMIREWIREDAACGQAREAPETLDAAGNAEAAGALCERLIEGWLRQAGLLPGGEEVERKPVHPGGHP